MNGGTNPVYQWQVNGINSGTNQNTFTTSSLDNNALVSAWNDVVPAATGIRFNVPANGEYRVMADKNPCLVYSKSNVAILRTSQTNNPYGINLYPNPGSKIITLDSIQLSQNWETLDIVTADGQRVFPSEHIKNKTTVSLDISGLRKGTYFVQLRRLNGKVTSIRFVKL